MSNSRRPSSDKSGTFLPQSPDSFLDNSKVREPDRDPESQSDGSFYRRDYPQSRDRSRTFDHDKTRHRYSSTDHTGPGVERSNMSSRPNMQDHRLQAMQSPSGSSERNSRQSSPKHNATSRPVSPKGDSAQPGAASKEITTSSTLPKKALASVADGGVSIAGSKPGSPDEHVIKDPRLRRNNIKVKLNSDVGVASLNIASHSATEPSTTQSFSLPNPNTPSITRGDVMTAVSDEEHATLQKRLDGDIDTNMVDVDQLSAIIPSAMTIDSNTSIQSPAASSPATDLMETFIQLMTDFTVKVSSTTNLRDKREIAKQKYSRCKHNDEKNRKHFKDFPITVEQGRQARQLAEQELTNVDKQLKDHVQAQNESAQKFAGFFVSQIEQQKSAQRTHCEQDKVFQQRWNKVEELSAHVATGLAELKQATQSTLKGEKEAYKLVERATSTGKEAQQVAQKTIAQVNELAFKVEKISRDSAEAQQAAQKTSALFNELTMKVDKLSRDFTVLDRDVADDHAEVRKVKTLTEHVDEDNQTLRKRMADTEKDVKCLWDDKAESTVLESMRKDVNKDVANFKSVQGQVKGQVKSLEAALKSCLQSCEVLAPEVERHGKKLENLISATKASAGTVPEGIYGVEKDKSAVVPYEQLEPLAMNLQSQLKNLQQSFQEVALKVQSCASRSELTRLGDLTSSLKIEIENLNAIGLQKELEDFRELTKEVDQLHAGQDEMQNSFTEHNEDIATKVETLKKNIHDVSVELRKTYEKAKEENENMAKQINGMSKRIEATMPAPAARPTPPSAPPTPQMHQAAQLPGCDPASPVAENGVANITHEMMNLKRYINGQLAASANMPARLNAIEQALMNLQSRYNNLTTEPVVRAMVQQLQLMYPYASTVQNEIRLLRAVVSELEKLPPVVSELEKLPAGFETLSTRMDQIEKHIESTDLKITDQDKECMSCDKKLESLAEHFREERRNLKQLIHEKHDALRQHVEESFSRFNTRIGQIDTRIGQSDTRIAAVEGSFSTMAELAIKITKLEQVAQLWTTANRAESKSQQSEKGDTPKVSTQLQLPTVSHSSPNDHWVSTKTSSSTPEESDAEQLLKDFKAPVHRTMVVPGSTGSDSDDSNTPLAVRRTDSPQSITVATASRTTSATSVKRKRSKNAQDPDEERAGLSEIRTPSSRRKVARRQ